MNKPNNILNARAKYVKNVVNKSKNTSKAIDKLSKELFLSPKTIERDLKK